MELPFNICEVANNTVPWLVSGYDSYNLNSYCTPPVPTNPAEL